MAPMSGKEVVVAAAVRTPIGRGHNQKGAFRDTHPSELLGATYQEVIARAGIPPSSIEQVVTGCVQQFGEQMLNIGRNAWLQAGLPLETPATTIDAQCGSSQQAVNLSAAMIASGAADVVIAAGVEHMGHIPLGTGWDKAEGLGTPWPPALLERYELVPQGISAESIARRWEISRRELDQLALRSHQLAARASAEGRFDAELVPIETEHGLVSTDQGIRRDTDLEQLAGLRPVFVQDGLVTAGNASQISDGASAVLLMSDSAAVRLGVAPLARIVDQVMTGVDPVLMLTGPISATQSLLARNAMEIADVDLFEVNEAFASVIAAWQRELDADMDRVNVNGGAIALGHPLGASGARLVTTALHELERSDREIALVTMCCAGGLGTGTLMQRL